MSVNIKIACQSFVAYIRERHPDFVLTPNNTTTIKLLIKYFCNDPTFETEDGYSLRKGIFLYGPYGTFKTKLMIYLSEWAAFKPFRIVACRDIQKECIEHGVRAVWQYGKESFKWKQHSGRVPENGSITYCFDDFGAESKSKYYGNDINVMEEILQDRYKYFDSFGLLTHITSNYGKDWDLLEEIYGPRVRSRCRQMFNFIELNDKDFRK